MAECALFETREPQNTTEKLFWNHSEKMKGVRIAAAVLGVIAIITALCLPLFGTISAGIVATVAIGGAIMAVGGAIGSPVLMGIPVLAIIAASVADEIMNPTPRVIVEHRHPLF